ncbi:MAG: membrane dipeptidase [Phycisphaerales bacterium]
MISSSLPVFDAHLDLAYLAELGRDMAVPLDRDALPHPPATVTLPELRSAGVTACLGTIFLEATDSPAPGDEPICYPPGDANEAYFKGVNQLNRYHLWRKEGLIRFFGDTDEDDKGGTNSQINLGILIEGADPIIEPHHLSFWAGRGVVAISLSWAVETRYAGGNSTSVGLSDLGRQLIGEMSRLGIVLDLSHLSERATMDALDFTDVRVCATHSNCRSLLGERNNPSWQRHLSDDTIKTVAARKGVIGLNLFKQFVQWPIAETERPSIGQAVDHIDHICQLTGSAQHVGIGSDLDGGFGANDVPLGIERASDLLKVIDELRTRGYSDADVRAIAYDNWAGFFSL